MATITSAGSGLWSAGATWVGGVAPADNDAVVIASGHVVVFDVDQSGFANGIDGITITGTLSLTRTTGTYYMKIKAAKTIGGAGTFDCGTSGSIIPFAAKHTITGGSGWYINGAAGLTMTVYAAEPVIKTVKLTGAEAIGATVLDVDTDITGDIWADGDTIRIDNINSSANSESRTIAVGGRASTTITITAGLTGAKIAGTLIHLITRNVRFLGVGAALLIRDFTSAKVTIGGGEFVIPTYTILNSCPDASILGGVFYGSGYSVSSCNGILISGGVFTANSYHIASCVGGRISGGIYSGASSAFLSNIGCSFSGINGSGNLYLFDYCQAMLLNSTIIGNMYGARYSNMQIFNSQFSGNSYDIGYSTCIVNNSIFGSTTENYRYTYNAKEFYSESIDHDQVAGAYKAWTKGGVTSSQASVLPAGYTTAMATVLENAAVEGYWQKEYTVGAGASIQFTMNLRKAASMTYLPRCIIFNKASVDPFAGGAGLHTFTMTDSIDTWEAESWTYTNATAADVTLVVRFQGMAAASATFYSALLAEQINVDLTSALAKLTAIQAKTDNLPADPADESALEAAIAAITVDNAAIAAAVMGSTVEGTLTTTQALRLMLAVLAGKASGGGTTTVKFRDTSDTKDRITATVDSNGNRSAVVLDGA